MSRIEPMPENFSSYVRATDIETVANAQAHLYYEEKSYSAPSTYKDIEKITAYIEKARVKDREKAGLTWWTGKVCLIACGSDVFKGDDEVELLSKFFTHLEDAEAKNAPYHLFGKNWVDFDKPFLIGRALAHNIGLPKVFRPNHFIEDINHIFSRSPRCAQVGSLQNYAWGLGLSGKLGSGSQVQAWYDSKDWDTIETYCRQDVALTLEVYKRAMKPFIPVNYDVPF